MHQAFSDQRSDWDRSKVFVWIKRNQCSCVLSVGMILTYHHDLQNYFCICSRFQSKPRQTEAFQFVCQQPLRAMASCEGNREYKRTWISFKPPVTVPKGEGALFALEKKASFNLESMTLKPPGRVLFKFESPLAWSACCQLSMCRVACCAIDMRQDFGGDGGAA